jgi:hypothetical protein
MTAQTLIERAYRLLGKKTVDSDDLSEGLESLNELVTSWRLEKLIPFNAMFATLQSNLAKPEYARVIRYNLAVELSDEKNNKISVNTITVARSLKKAMKEAAAIQTFSDEVEFDSYLTHSLRR